MMANFAAERTRNEEPEVQSPPTKLNEPSLPSFLETQLQPHMDRQNKTLHPSHNQMRRSRERGSELKNELHASIDLSFEPNKKDLAHSSIAWQSTSGP